jgi:hypothetical protein
MIFSMARRKRQRQRPRLRRPLNPPKPVRPSTTVDSAKLLRAVDLFVEYQISAGKWVTQEGVQAVSPGSGTLALTFPPAPTTISVIIGDCLQDLRSALDHEIYRQSQQLNGPQWPGLAQTQFPIHADSKTFRIVRQNVLAGLPPEVVHVVESLQPYAAPLDPAAPTLELLHLAARIDRHRLLHVAAAQPKAYGIGRFRPELSAVEAELTVRLELIDFVEPRLMNLDIHQFLLSAIEAVDMAIRRIQEAARQAAGREGS